MVGFPNNHGCFPSKNDQHLGCEMGVPLYHHLRKHPYNWVTQLGSHPIRPSVLPELASCQWALWENRRPRRRRLTGRKATNEATNHLEDHPIEEVIIMDLNVATLRGQDSKGSKFLFDTHTLWVPNCASSKKLLDFQHPIFGQKQRLLWWSYFLRKMLGGSSQDVM